MAENRDLWVRAVKSFESVSMHHELIRRTYPRKAWSVRTRSTRISHAIFFGPFCHPLSRTFAHFLSNVNSGWQIGFAGNRPKTRYAQGLGALFGIFHMRQFEIVVAFLSSTFLFSTVVCPNPFQNYSVFGRTVAISKMSTSLSSPHPTKNIVIHFKNTTVADSNFLTEIFFLLLKFLSCFVLDDYSNGNSSSCWIADQFEGFS